MPDHFNTPWRELATALYGQPSEGKIYGTMDLDLTETLAFMRDYRATTRTSLTITHVMTAILGRVLAQDVPELNCFVRRGRVVPRQRVDVCVTAEVPDGVGLIRVRDADRASLAEIADAIRTEATAQRSGRHPGVNRQKELLGRIPWPLRRPAMRAIGFAVHELGLRFGSLSADSFGSILLSNIGVFGLGTGMLALFPAAHLPAAIAIGKIEERAVVRGGEVVVRPILPVTGTFDHRLVDGAQAGKLANGVRRLIENPAQLRGSDR